MTTSDLVPSARLADGAAMPLIGFGTWRLSGDTAYRAVRHALDVGYRMIDTATMYGNEAEVGRALHDSDVSREEVFVTTKLLPENVGRERENILDSLRLMGLDQVDLWLVHWPPNGVAGPATWAEFVAARDDGLTRSVGVSNYSTAQIDELTEATGVTPVVNQIKWSPSLFDAERLAQLRERRIVLEGYSPFRATNLTDPLLVRIADQHGVTPAQVVLRWHIEHGIVTIPRSQTPERITQNLDVFGFELTDDEVASLNGLGGG